MEIIDNLMSCINAFTKQDFMIFWMLMNVGDIIKVKFLLNTEFNYIYRFI